MQAMRQQHLPSDAAFLFWINKTSKQLILKKSMVGLIKPVLYPNHDIFH
jgi:hypothetical protein